MSLFLSKEVGKRGKLGIWQITESLDELMKVKFFLEKDLSFPNSFSYENRKKEYIVARILAGQLTGESNVRIIYDKHNKPFLENSKKHISISHSHHLLAVIIDARKTGIDTELIKSKILRIKEKFMNKDELNAVQIPPAPLYKWEIQKENEIEQLTVYWCAKESLYKWYGKRELVFKENLFIEPFEYMQKGSIKGWIKNLLMKKSFLLHYEKLNVYGTGYMITYLVNED